nr:hypothetical protein CFP56_25944 [Quercus suber]
MKGHLILTVLRNRKPDAESVHYALAQLQDQADWCAAHRVALYSRDLDHWTNQFTVWRIHTSISALNWLWPLPCRDIMRVRLLEGSLRLDARRDTSHADDMSDAVETYWNAHEPRDTSVAAIGIKN